MAMSMAKGDGRGSFARIGTPEHTSADFGDFKGCTPVDRFNPSVGSTSSTASAFRRSALPAVVDCEKIEIGETRALIGAESRREPGKYDAPAARPTRWKRDLVMIACGAAMASSGILGKRLWCQWRSASDTPACEPLNLPAAASNSNSASQGSTFAFDDAVEDVATQGFPVLASGRRRLDGTADDGEFAFVTIAYDTPGTPQVNLWRSLALAQAIRKVSRRPLVLLTNSSELVVGGQLPSYLQRLHVRVLPVQEVLVPEGGGSLLHEEQRRTFWQLQIWRLTQYKRLLWLDVDTAVVRGVDEFFTHHAGEVLGVRCASSCATSMQAVTQVSTASAWCSGVMLMEPNISDFEGLILAAGRDSTWTQRGVEQLIFDYFRSMKTVRTFDFTVAAPGVCLEKGADRDVVERFRSRVPWVMPALVHRSSEHVNCFDYDIGAQRVREGYNDSICTFHPLGAYWRDMFCGAARGIGVDGAGADLWPMAAEFCADRAWFGHGPRVPS